MPRDSSLLLLSLATLLTGCAYPNQFRNVRIDAPHAVVVGDGVAVMHINGQRTSFWQSRQRFHIPPGPTILRTVAGHWDIRAYMLSFTAAGGHTYSLRRQRADTSDSVVLRDDSGQVVAEAESQDPK